MCKDTTATFCDKSKMWILLVVQEWPDDLGENSRRSSSSGQWQFPPPPGAEPHKRKGPRHGDSCGPERIGLFKSHTMAPSAGKKAAPADGEDPDELETSAERKVACDRCRIRKRRCNGEDPCKSCVRTENECTWLGLGKRPSRAKKRFPREPLLVAPLKPPTTDPRQSPAGLPADRLGTVSNGVSYSEPERQRQLLVLGTTLGVSPAAVPAPSPFLLDGGGAPFAGNFTIPAIGSPAYGLAALQGLGSPNFHMGFDVSRAIQPVQRNPTSAPALPTTPIIMACLERFFMSSDLNLPTLHRGRFYERFPPSALLLSSILLYSPVFDPSVDDLIATCMSKRDWDRLIFARAKTELSAMVDWLSLPMEQPNAADNLIATFLLGIWAAFSGLTKLSKGLYDLTMYLARTAGWITNPSSPALPFRARISQRFGPDILTTQLGLAEISLLRNLWIDHNVQHRTMSVFGLAEQTRRDWMRGIDQPAELNEFDVAYRPAPPTFQVWEKSFDLTFDPRLVPDPPMLIHVISWADMERNSRSRTQALAQLPHYITHTRSALPHLHGKMRAVVDDFLRACRSAGLVSPAQLPPIAPTTPANIPLEVVDNLLVHRQRVDEVLQDLRANVPVDVMEAWTAGSASRMIAALLPSSGQFYNIYNMCSHVPSMLMLRAELYTSIGVCFTRGLDAELMTENMAILADEFGSGKEPFAEFLEDALLFTRFHNELLSLNPTLQFHVAGNIAGLLRATMLHMAFLKRFKAAIASDPAIGTDNPPQVSESVLDQVAWDVDVLLRVLEAFAARHGRFFSAAYSFAKKLHEDQRMSPFELEAARLRVDLDPEEDENAEGTVLAAPQNVDHGLANLLAVYQARTGF